MYYFEDRVARATEKVGIRGVLGETVIGMPAPDAREPYGGLPLAERFICDFAGSERIVPAVAPHATYTLHPAKLRECRALAEKYRVPMLLHAAEFPDESQRVQTRYGTNPDGLSIIAYLDREGVLFDGLCIAHGIHMDDTDIEILAEHNVGVAVNTIANTKGATGVAPVLEMMGAGLRVGLGTDGPMSANTLDMFNAMGYTARVTKLAHRDNTVMVPRDVVRLATLGGAEALGLADRVGSLEVGKCADIVIVSRDSLNMLPDYDPYATLVYAASPLNVTTVICNGRVSVEDRKLLTCSKEAAVRGMIRLGRKVRQAARDLGE